MSFDVPKKAYRPSEGLVFFEVKDTRGRNFINSGEEHILFLKTLCEILTDFNLRLVAFATLPSVFFGVVNWSNQEVSNFAERLLSEYWSLFISRHTRRSKVPTCSIKTNHLPDLASQINTIAYIWNEPVKRGLCKEISEYQWSSYRLLRKKSQVIDKETLSSLMSESEWQLYALNYKHTCPSPLSHNALSDSEACNILRMASALTDFAHLALLPIEEQRTILKKAFSQGVSKRQVYRLTPFSFYMIEKILSTKDSSSAFTT